MKKTISILLALACVMGMLSSACAEKGFETLYGLYCTEEVFGEPVTTYDYEGEGDAKVCLAIFLFDTENDMTQAILIGRNEQDEEKYHLWITDYEPGATIMTFLLSRYEDFLALCEKDVDFCVSFSFDGGETMTDLATAEDAAAFMAQLQGDAAQEPAQ